MIEIRPGDERYHAVVTKYYRCGPSEKCTISTASSIFAKISKIDIIRIRMMNKAIPKTMTIVLQRARRVKGQQPSNSMLSMQSIKCPNCRVSGFQGSMRHSAMTSNVQKHAFGGRR